MNIMLNFLPVICKNKKFMSLFVKTLIFSVFSRFQYFFYAFYINFRQNDQWKLLNVKTHHNDYLGIFSSQKNQVKSFFAISVFVAGVWDVPVWQLCDSGEVWQLRIKKKKILLVFYIEIEVLKKSFFYSK